MGFQAIHTACLEGSRVLPVTIEVDVRPGLPVFSIIGLPDKRIDEARERVRAALRNSKLPFPSGRVTVNLAPSTVRKHGTGFDLAIALALAAVAGYPVALPAVCWVFGELGLDGTVRPVPNLIALLVEAAKRGVTCVIPQVQVEQAGLVAGLIVQGLERVSDPITESGWCMPPRLRRTEVVKEDFLIDTVVGQESAKRALALALAGRHHLLMIGPPGAGKSMLAQAAAELLPPLTSSDELELAQQMAYAQEVYSFDGRAPFRSMAPPGTVRALVGGGVPVRPGELSLAHGGVLFMDEFSEYRRVVRDALRIPLQQQRVHHLREGVAYDFPCKTTLIAAMNSCPCGRLGVEGEECTCTAAELARHAQSLSAPITDRFAMTVLVRRVPSVVWQNGVGGGMSGKYIRDRLGALQGDTRLRIVTTEAQALLMRAVDSYRLSGRTLESMGAVAQTIARFDGCELVDVPQVAEAIQYRFRPFSG